MLPFHEELWIILYSACQPHRGQLGRGRKCDGKAFYPPKVGCAPTIYPIPGLHSQRGIYCGILKLSRTVCKDISSDFKYTYVTLMVKFNFLEIGKHLIISYLHTLF